MGWIELRPYSCAEKDIQEYFTTKFGSPAGWRRAGAPGWLEVLEPAAPNKHVPTSLGYGFRPDLLAKSGTENLVLELKCATKGEPLALSEVLHHAWMLAHHPRALEAEGGPQRRTPVLVTQYHNWLRASLAFLHEAGMPQDAIKYVEFTTLKAGAEAFIWFDEPFAEWKEAAEPALPDGLVVRGFEWRSVKGADTWIALKDPPAARPPLWTVPYLMLAALPERGQALTWSGAPGEPGQYLLWKPDSGNTSQITVSF